jgi:hypothetical protein
LPAAGRPSEHQGPHLRPWQDQNEASRRAMVTVQQEWKLRIPALAPRLKARIKHGPHSKRSLQRQAATFDFTQRY